MYAGVILFQVTLELFIQDLVFLHFLFPAGMAVRAPIFEPIVHQESVVEDDELVTSHVHLTRLFHTQQKEEKAGHNDDKIDNDVNNDVTTV